ncbi:MAG: GNAT family N-acetyltransferase, partial [Pseudomonadota bacterium]
MRSTPSSPTRERTGVRAATVADASQILAVQARTWDAAYRGLLPDRALPRADDPQRLAFWRSVLMTGRTAARVATTRDGAVVGFSTGGPARDRALGTDQEIHTLYVLPEHQGAGLGRKLFRRTVAVLQ